MMIRELLDGKEIQIEDLKLRAKEMEELIDKQRQMLEKHWKEVESTKIVTEEELKHGRQ